MLQSKEGRVSDGRVEEWGPVPAETRARTCDFRVLALVPGLSNPMNVLPVTRMRQTENTSGLARRGSFESPLQT